MTKLQKNITDMKYLYAFLGGAIVGAAASILFAPEKGEDLRDQIKNILRRHGIIKGSEMDELVEQIATQIEEEIG